MNGAMSAIPNDSSKPLIGHALHLSNHRKDVCFFELLLVVILTERAEQLSGVS